MDEKIKAFLAKLNTPVKTLWENNKIFVIAFFILILIIKFRDVIIDYLFSSSKKTLEEAKKKDSQLKKEEDAANAKADALVADANKLDENKETIDENWNKKKE